MATVSGRRASDHGRGIEYLEVASGEEESRDLAWPLLPSEVEDVDAMVLWRFAAAGPLQMLSPAHGDCL